LEGITILKVHDTNGVETGLFVQLAETMLISAPVALAKAVLTTRRAIGFVAKAFALPTLMSMVPGIFAYAIVPDGVPGQPPVVELGAVVVTPDELPELLLLPVAEAPDELPVLLLPVA